MSEYDPSDYGRQVGSDYDRLYASIPDTDEAVERLAELAAAGPVLEFGVGTGRLALPLAARGLAVHGIDASTEMVAVLREKPGGRDIAVTMGDYSSVTVEGSFSLVVAPLNSVLAIPNQDGQVRLFENAVRHLAPGGLMVVEAYVLDQQRVGQDPSVEPRFRSRERVELQLISYEPVEQRVERTLVHLATDGTRLLSFSDRYAPPSELDLMARLAGLRLRERWSGWDRAPFGPASRRHVSVYALA